MLATNSLTLNLEGLWFFLSTLESLLVVIAAIVALVFLAKLLSYITKLTDSLGRVVNENRGSIDATMAEVPKVTRNVNVILTSVDGLVHDAKRPIVSTLNDVNNVTSQISNVATNISDTVEVVGLAAADTANRFTKSVTSATDYIGLAKGILSLVFKRRR